MARGQQAHCCSSARGTQRQRHQGYVSQQRRQHRSSTGTTPLAWRLCPLAGFAGVILWLGEQLVHSRDQQPCANRDHEADKRVVVAKVWDHTAANRCCHIRSKLRREARGPQTDSAPHSVCARRVNSSYGRAMFEGMFQNRFHAKNAGK